MRLTVVRKSKFGLLIKLPESIEFEIPFPIWEKYRLYVDYEIDELLLKKILFESEYFRARNYVMWLLAKRSYFESELKKKLFFKKYNREIIDEVLQDVKKLGFINDEKYAEEFVENKIKMRKFGLIRIGNELRRKGVSKNIIDKLIKKNEDEEIVKLNIHTLAQKKFDSLIKKENDMRKISQKIYSHLVGKGYSSELILEELRKLKVHAYEEI
ncbi:MAG: hypothetical protein Fur0015_03130 [Ignavibacteriales bacterium]